MRSWTITAIELVPNSRQYRSVP